MEGSGREPVWARVVGGIVVVVLYRERWKSCGVRRRRRRILSQSGYLTFTTRDMSMCGFWFEVVEKKQKTCIHQ